jgi:hypothetical protein
MATFQHQTEAGLSDLRSDQQNVTTPSGKFDRAEYNRQYYLRNKETLCEKRNENYRRNKGAKALNEYINTHLDEDLVVIRDELLKTDESDPAQYQTCVDLMNLAKLLIEIKYVAIGASFEEIQKIRNHPVET